jgi:signal transduction histidine kinase
MFERDSDVEKLEGRDRSIEIVTTEDAGESSTGDLPTATITVSDHGPGFSDETLVHVFEPFYSGRGSSGLGMAVCYGIVRDLGGQIAAANRTTGGAEMKVILPIRAQAATNPPAEGSL